VRSIPQKSRPHFASEDAVAFLTTRARGLIATRSVLAERHRSHHYGGFITEKGDYPMTNNSDTDLVRACDQMREALQKIAGQAVCVNMDGDAGNERMLKYIQDIADEALATHSTAPPPDPKSPQSNPFVRACQWLVEAYEEGNAESYHSKLTEAYNTAVLAFEQRQNI
jgi:hypothetical protein